MLESLIPQHGGHKNNMSWPVSCAIGVVFAMLVIVWIAGFRVAAVVLALCFAGVYMYLHYSGMWSKIWDLSTALSTAAPSTATPSTGLEHDQSVSLASTVQIEEAASNEPVHDASELSSARTKRQKRQLKATHQKTQTFTKQETQQEMQQRMLSVSYEKKEKQKQTSSPQKQAASRLLAAATTGTFGSGIKKQHLSAYSTVVQSASALNESNRNIQTDKNRRTLPSQAGLAAQNARTRGVVLPEPPSARKNLLTTMVRNRRRPRRSMYLVPLE